MLYHIPLSKARAGLSYQHICVGLYIDTYFHPFSSLYRLPLVRTYESGIAMSMGDLFPPFFRPGLGFTTILPLWVRCYNYFHALDSCHV